MHLVSQVSRGEAARRDGVAAASYVAADASMDAFSAVLKNAPVPRDSEHVFYTANDGLRHIHAFLPPRPDDTLVIAEAWRVDDPTYKLLTKPLWVLARCAALKLSIEGLPELEKWCSANGFVIATPQAFITLVTHLPHILAERIGQHTPVPVSYRATASDAVEYATRCLQSGEPFDLIIGEAPGYTPWPTSAGADDAPIAPVAFPSALPQSPEEAALATLAFAFHLPEAASTLPPEAHTAPFNVPDPSPILEELEAGFAEMLGDRMKKGHCGACGQLLSAPRLRCLTCPNWEACMSCSQTLSDVHPGHKFVPFDAEISNPFPEQWRAHPGVKCSRCGREIVGPRFKCTICRDFDLCACCESVPINTHGESHGYEHLLAKIDVPLDDDTWRKTVFARDPFAPTLDSPDPFTDPTTPGIPFMLRGLSEAASLAHSTLQHPLVERAAPIVQQAFGLAAAIGGSVSQRSAGGRARTQIPLAQAIVQVVAASLPRPLNTICDLDRLGEAIAQVVQSANGSQTVVEIETEDAPESGTFMDATEDIVDENETRPQTARLPARADDPLD